MVIYLWPVNIKVMKYLLSFAFASCMLCGCSVTQNTEMNKFTVDMNIVKTHRPDLYDRYMKGEVVIDDVYLDETTTIPFYGVDYHIVAFEPASTVR